MSRDHRLRVENERMTKQRERETTKRNTEKEAIERISAGVKRMKSGIAAMEEWDGVEGSPPLKAATGTMKKELRRLEGELKRVEQLEQGKEVTPAEEKRTVELHFDSVEKKMYFWDTETEMATWEDPEEEKKSEEKKSKTELGGSVTIGGSSSSGRTKEEIQADRTPEKPPDSEKRWRGEGELEGMEDKKWI